MAQRALITLADQLEHARALRDVVVRLRQAAGRCRAARRAAEGIRPTRPAWRARRCASPTASESRLGFGRAAGREQRFARDQIGLNRFRRRCFRGDFVGEPQRFFRCPAPSGKLGFEHADRPLVPEACLRAVAAVRLAGLPQVVAGRLVAAAHQRDLRERVVHRAGNFVELRLACATPARGAELFRRAPACRACTRICPSVASEIARPRPGPFCSCSAALCSASASACSWRC